MFGFRGYAKYLSGMRFFLELQYKGTKYRGWQRQLKVNSVQKEVEDALTKIFKRKVTTHCCGRTDAGVHASQFFAHTYLEEKPDFNLKERLNYMLSQDVRIARTFPVRKMNAQLSALSRTYIYKLHGDDNPFLADLSTLYPIQDLDFSLLEKSAVLVKNGIDFKAFCKRPDLMNHTRCRIDQSFWTKFGDNNSLSYTVQGDRFLRGMVRLLVGTMLEVGCGKMPIDQFEDHLLNQTTLTKYNVAFPQGLYLAGVEYPEGFDALEID